MDFDKFTYVLENKKYEELFMDKDHYNTLEPIQHTNTEFKITVIQNISILFFIFGVFDFIKVIFFYKSKNSNINYFYLFFL